MMPDAALASPAGQPPGTGRTALQWLRRNQEGFWWAALIGVLVYLQWPMLRGYYFKLRGTAAPRGTIAWRTDLGAALVEARRVGRPVLLDAGASWCPPCIAMDHDVWPDAAVARLVDAGYVPVKIDVDRAPDVATRYDIATIPAVMLLDSDGTVVRRAGYLPTSGMVRFLSDPRWSD
jgi:thiol-disulfide isomerase/thioredoxin